jgi:hypothetical protein
MDGRIDSFSISRISYMDKEWITCTLEAIINNKGTSPLLMIDVHNMENNLLVQEKVWEVGDMFRINTEYEALEEVVVMPKEMVDVFYPEFLKKEMAEVFNG